MNAKAVTCKNKIPFSHLTTKAPLDGGLGH